MSTWPASSAKGRRRVRHYREVRGVVEGLHKRGLLPGKQPGIRAQVVDRQTAELVNDFVVANGPCSTHVLNAVLPTFTYSLPFARHVVDHMKPGG